MKSISVINILVFAFLILGFSFLNSSQVKAECEGGTPNGTLDRIEICDGTKSRGEVTKCIDLGDTSSTSNVSLLCKNDCTIDSSMCGGGFNLDPTTDAPEDAPTDIDNVVIDLINWILGFASSIAILALIWGGVQYMTSAGDTSKAENSKKTVSAGLIGLTIAGIAFAIVNVIVSTILT